MGLVTPLTLFNLGWNGTVQFLYPIARLDDARRIPPGQTFQLPKIHVNPPFDADHLVAVTSQALLSTLHDRLADLNGMTQAMNVGS